MSELQPLYEQALAGRGLWLGLLGGDHHCTVVHLGKRCGEQHVVALADTARRLVVPSLPVECRVGGIARFCGSQTEGDPVVMLLQQPRLRELQQSVVHALAGYQISVSQFFDYTPHLTMRRAAWDEVVEITGLDRPPPVLLDRAVVVCGEATYEVK